MSAFCLSEQQRALLPTETLFEYRGQERYLSMEEYIKASPNEECLHSHVILDEQLSIVLKKKKEIIRLPTAPPFHEEPLIAKVEIHEQPLLFQKAYQKYCELDDFVFGREHWGRTVNCLRIPSDLISRLHARLWVNKLAIRQSKEELSTCLRKAVSLARYSSPVRKVPLELWAKVMEYAEERTKYLLRDCGSRNGTFLMNFSQEGAILHTGEGYEFESRDYIIYVNQILQLSGSELAKRLTAFQEHWKSQEFYNHRYSSKTICPLSLRAALPSLEGQVHAIHFQAEFSQELKYFFWVISVDEESYGIGQGQMIAVSPSPEQPSYESGRHGSLLLREGRWSLQHGYVGERLWVKLPPEKDYELNPASRYRIRLGHMNIVDLTFHNFS